MDPCRPATASDKGKVERQVRTDRAAFADLFVTAWPTLDALQAALDTRAAGLHQRRRCPATGTTVAEALTTERSRLQPVPRVHEPFDCVRIWVCTEDPFLLNLFSLLLIPHETLAR